MILWLVGLLPYASFAISFFRRKGLQAYLQIQYGCIVKSLKAFKAFDCRVRTKFDNKWGVTAKAFYSVLDFVNEL